MAYSDTEPDASDPASQQVSAPPLLHPHDRSLDDASLRPTRAQPANLRPMSEPGIIFSAQVQPNMVFPTAVIEGVQPLHVENREPRGRYARPFPVTNAERRETHSDDEAHILAIRRGVQAIRRWMNRPAASRVIKPYTARPS